MEGILLVDKPQGFTSFDVIAKLRGILGQRRLGHSGTLDPMATGVLVVFAGAATRAIDRAPDHSKSYQAVVRLGMRTDTGDVTGQVLERSDVRPSMEALCEAAAGFVGETLQVPPMYSALKVQGKRLYDLARQGQEVERAPRPIVIHRIALAPEGPDQFHMTVDCQKGVYIRTLAEDIARACGALGTLQSLVRTASGGFPLASCHSLEEIEAAAAAGTAESLFLPVEKVFLSLPALSLRAPEARLFLNGFVLPTVRVGAAEGEYRVYRDKTFLGLGTARQGSFKKTAQFYWE